MSIHLYPGTRPDDYVPMAAILNASRTLQTTPEEIAQERGWWPAGSVAHLVMARNGAGEVVGFGEAHRFPNTAEGKFYGSVFVHPTARRQGAGSALLAEVERFAAEHGGSRVVVDVEDTDAASLAYAERRGYTVDRHDWDSTLDLQGFDEAPFAGALARVEASGIRFFTLADRPDVLPGLYQLYGATMVDIPGYEAKSFMTYETWLNALIEGEGARPDWVIIAGDGDRLVGVTQVVATQDHLYTNHTLVDRAYRGRGIALALKLLTIRKGLMHGAPYMRTGNDSLNGPMLAVNRKLGYKPLVGVYSLVRRLVED